MSKLVSASTSIKLRTFDVMFTVGESDGINDGGPLGFVVGTIDGPAEGATVGEFEGAWLGAAVGLPVVG